MLLSISHAAPVFGVCTKTLRRWHARGILYPDCRTPGGHRRYDLQTLETFLHVGRALKIIRKKKRVEPAYTNQFRCAAIYARVSAIKQKTDLTRQISFLTQTAFAAGFGEVCVYKDVASGLNEKRQSLKRLIRDAFARKFTAVFITHGDRLARFGTSIIRQVLGLLKVPIRAVGIVTAPKQQTENPMHTLVEDVLAILTSYPGKLYRLRRGTFAAQTPALSLEPDPC
ncbi:MAG: IS607 family transposase [Promethearchaeota archaeon]